jgi:hypothetical protein
MSLALVDKISEHLSIINVSNCLKDNIFIAYLDSVERSASTLRVKLDAPDLLARLGGGFNTLHGGVVAINKERFPSSRERVLQLQRVLVILAFATYQWGHKVP